MISIEEMMNIKAGDAIKTHSGVWTIAERDAFWNSDADEPEWEVETDAGWLTYDSIEEVKHVPSMDAYRREYRTRDKELVYIVQCTWHTEETDDQGDEIYLVTPDETLARRCYEAHLFDFKNSKDVCPESWEIEESENSFECYEQGNYILNHVELRIRTEELVK